MTSRILASFPITNNVGKPDTLKSLHRSPSLSSNHSENADSCVNSVGNEGLILMKRYEPLSNCAATASNRGNCSRQYGQLGEMKLMTTPLILLTSALEKARFKFCTAKEGIASPGNRLVATLVCLDLRL